MKRGVKVFATNIVKAQAVEPLTRDPKDLTKLSKKAAIWEQRREKE